MTTSAATESRALASLTEELIASYNQAVRHSNGSFVQLTARLSEPIDPLCWLSGNNQEHAFYWSDRERSVELACMGYAYAVEELQPSACVERIEAYLKAQPELFAIGGFRFDPNFERQGAEWSEFAASRFLIPYLALRTQGGQQQFQIVLPAQQLSETQLKREIQAAIERLSLSSQPASKSDRNGVRVESDRITPDWEEAVVRSLQSISEGHFQKIVLARAIDFAFRDKQPPWSLLAALRENAPGTTLFGYAPSGNSLFFGASPERLYRRSQQTLQTEAIAGTVRGTDGVTSLAGHAAFTEKDFAEHEPVLRHLQTTLAPLATALTVPAEPTVSRLRHLSHLKATIEATLREQITDAELIAAIHPTPAVAGYPVLEATSQLSSFESIDRGWYAGGIGLVSSQTTEIAVAIRSALWQPERLRLFVGAGIVSGSTAEAEWLETEAKAAPLLELFRS